MLPTNPKQYIFGTRPIIESILAGKEISKIWIKNQTIGPAHKELLRLAQEHKIPCSKVPLAKLNQLTKKNHQGVIALISPVVFANLANVLQSTYEKGKVPLVVVLDQLQDIRNFGALARTALATGVDALVVPMEKTAVPNSDAMKASAGALAHLTVCREPRLTDTLKYLHTSGLQLVACHEKAAKTFYQADFTVPTVLLLGGEERGIHPDHLRLADIQVSIPMQGPVASLNVSVAGAVMLYEVVRQRQNQPQ